ncbi:MAG: ABC transporter substrate-binding protein [Pseudomonadota bacterium]
MPFSTNLTRRTLLAGLASTAIAAPALALTENEARSLVGKLVGEINTVISSGKSEAGMIRDFEGIFNRYADVNIMAQYALGADGRSASGAQKRRFADVFAGYISRKYGKRFREFIGGRIEVRSARAIRAGYEIRTTAFLRGSSPFEVTFLVSDRSGSDKFFNMFIEGVNLLLTERTEIGALIDRNGGNIDAMIQDLSRLG